MSNSTKCMDTHSWINIRSYITGTFTVLLHPTIGHHRVVNVVFRNVAAMTSKGNKDWKTPQRQFYVHDISFGEKTQLYEFDMLSVYATAEDTTGGTTGATFYYLLKNPDTLTKLRTELRDAGDLAHPSRTPRPETSLTLTPRSKKPWASSPSWTCPSSASCQPATFAARAQRWPYYHMSFIRTRLWRRLGRVGEVNGDGYGVLEGMGSLCRRLSCWKHWIFLLVGFGVHGLKVLFF